MVRNKLKFSKSINILYLYNMKYCVQTETCIFSRFTEQKFALSSQNYKLYRNCCIICPKKFVEETKNKYPLTLKFENLQLCIYDTVLRKDIIYFYFETNNPDSILLDKIYKDKKIPVFADGKNQKPKCNKFVPSVQNCSLLPTGGNYSTQIEINGQPLIVTLDTGSSTLGVPTDSYVKPKDFYGNPLPTYNSAKDRCFKTTDYIQNNVYGGIIDRTGWAGSNLISRLDVGNKKLNYMQFGAGYYTAGNYSSISSGGIIGLAFPNLNTRINYGKTSYPPTEEMLTEKFWTEETKKPQTVFPTFMDYYGQKYSNYSQKFGIWVQRNIVSNPKNEEDSKKDRSNFGKFILGGGESLTSLYNEELSVIPVIKTTTYYIPLFPGMPAPPPFTELAYYTIALNEIIINDTTIPVSEKIYTFIDSGTTRLTFPSSLYEHIKNIFINTNIPLNCDGTGYFWDKYSFEDLAEVKPVNKDDICLKYWPVFEFPLTDTAGNKKIFKISPKNYWNIQNNQYFFNIGGEINFTSYGSIILGHPFLCENYCVFDYGQKQVKIAPRN